ncbi:hypothetical protein F4821DRAFT_9418 [Hypoxylon rubiginosum]|uniref:Uncharacterized protein n=1 Tax=Hypoxylon rubiginosum TaxID=110542 RepID=A0ACC0DDW7_9PEZI|nr:hypothetical protein F4821DRAFT_9418 [Hypoxylon rubiginosum]
MPITDHWLWEMNLTAATHLFVVPPFMPALFLTAKAAVVALHMLARLRGSRAGRNGIESIHFDSYFPLSFQVSSDPAIKCRGDPRQILLAVSITFTVSLSLFTSSPSLQFAITFTAIFAHVGLVSDPPSAAFHNTSVLPDHVSLLVERFLPAAFIAFVLYRTCITRALQGLQAQFEKTIFWLGGFWVGALSNYTFD